MKFEFSAGGVVFKKDSDQTWILVAQHSQHHGWVFPKGLIDPTKRSGQARMETKEDAALREVREETGVIGKILKPLSPIAYWYIWEKERIKKTVYYFLMEYISGDISEHDMEMENVEWIPVDEVEERLTFKADQKVWSEAQKLITDNLTKRLSRV